jgi:signal transduction histidine kinase
MLRQIAAGACLFILGTALGAFVVSFPVRSRTSLGAGFPGDFLRLVGIGSLTWYACLLSSPLYVWLARRFPIYGRRWARSLAIHVAITTVLVAITGWLYFQLLLPGFPARPGSGFRGPNLANFLMMRFFTESLPFWAMIALIHAFEFHRRYRQREVELAESRLAALTAQLHPHFLFNTLQGISTLMHRDVKAADAMLSRLSDLLRQTLQRDRQETPLREEMEMLDHYMAISHERFKDRLVFEVRVAEDARDALVPFFILQPLVENALQHGIAKRAGTGRVCVRARRDGESLRLSVSDDGPGLSKDLASEGIGLSNTRERLKQLYDDRQSLTLNTAPEGGLIVELTIPFRPASLQEAEAIPS